MPDLLLHHYAGSPFSEKVRLVLGFKRLAWSSVIVPTVMPKPDVTALTGGYRRTPFLQVASDIYCDTALICKVLDRLRPEPPLYPPPVAGLAEIVAQWADTSLFWTAVPFTMQPAGAVHVLKGATPEAMKAFGADRAAMNPGFHRPTPADGEAALVTALARLDDLLADGRPFLLGAEPSIADFSAVQSVWFMRLAPPIAARLAPYPRLLAWQERVAAIGHGTMTKVSSDDAIRLAADGRFNALAPFAAEAGLFEGAAVTVTPTDYAQDAVAGRLVGLSRESVAVERTDPRAGTVRVHFPRIGYRIESTAP